MNTLYEPPERQRTARASWMTHRKIFIGGRSLNVLSHRRRFIRLYYDGPRRRNVTLAHT